MATIVLTKSREGGDITFHLRIKDNGVYLSWDDLQEKRVFLFSDAQDVIAGECRQVTVRESDSTYLDCVYGGDQPQYLGENSVLVRAEYRGRQKTYDKKAIYIVARTAELEGEEIVVTDPEVDVDIDVADVSTSILEAAIAAAIAAAADAEEAAHLVPLQVLQDCREATGEAVEAAGNANDAAEEARAAGEHSAPIIGPNGNWWRWLPEISQYVDTGNPSCGPQGERGPQGVSIQSIEQTQTSEESEGENRITVTLDNGQTATFVVRNGAQGIQGAPGVANAKYRQVASLPVASVDTMDYIYLVESATAGIYNMSYTEYDPSTDTYSWHSLGTTAIQLSDYATKEELSQLGQEVDEKFEREHNTDTLYIVDGFGNIITRIDADGVNTVDVRVKIDGELVSVKSLLANLNSRLAAEQLRAETEEAKKLDKVIDDDALIIMDENGYIITKIDASGVHSAQDKHAVACMVLGEYYYPTATPTRDASGNITYADVMFGTGVSGSLSITYTEGNATQVVAHYGSNTYTISIQRDAQGNVNTVSVN